MQGNGLLESFEGIDLSNLSEPDRFGVRVIGSNQHELDLTKVQAEIVEDNTAAQASLAELEERYFACHDPTEKERLRGHIDAAVLRAVDDRLARRRDEIEISIQQREMFQRGRARSPTEEKKRAAMETELASLTEKQTRLHALLANPRAERPFFFGIFGFVTCFRKRAALTL
jgi:hypothetical protein